MRLSALQSDILRFIVENGYQPGDQLPTIQDISRELGVSVAKTREALEIARALGMVEIKPGRGTQVVEYTFAPAVMLSALYAIGLDGRNFAHLRQMRDALEIFFWEQAVSRLTPEDIAELRELIASAEQQLQHEPAQMPAHQHRAFHLLIFSRLENPFVYGFLEAFWEAYEAFGLHLYRDLSYLQKVWDYHRRIVDAIEAKDYELSRRLLVEHMNMLNERRPTESNDSGLTLQQRARLFE
ncbi:MAG TPA: FCD domain-containing protein [Aggregatilineales bacterium]|nr:FCD domain-containing protein [Aggregatilineales bacterium]